MLKVGIRVGAVRPEVHRLPGRDHDTERSEKATQSEAAHIHQPRTERVRFEVASVRLTIGYRAAGPSPLRLHQELGRCFDPFSHQAPARPSEALPPQAHPDLVNDLIGASLDTSDTVDLVTELRGHP